MKQRGFERKQSWREVLFQDFLKGLRTTTKTLLSHRSPTFLWKRATPVIMGWFAGRTWKITVSGIPNSLHYCVNFIVCTQFTDVAVGSGLETHALSRQLAPWPRFKLGTSLIKVQSTNCYVNLLGSLFILWFILKCQYCRLHIVKKRMNGE